MDHIPEENYLTNNVQYVCNPIRTSESIDDVSQHNTSNCCLLNGLSESKLFKLCVSAGNQTPIPIKYPTICTLHIFWNVETCGFGMYACRVVAGVNELNQDLCIIVQMYWLLLFENNITVII